MLVHIHVRVMQVGIRLTPFVGVSILRLRTLGNCRRGFGAKVKRIGYNTKQTAKVLIRPVIKPFLRCVKPQTNPTVNVIAAHPDVDHVLDEANWHADH